ncbi:DUF6053 domain-containing protein [Lysobacter enzymogenes]|uniref:DUF6053 domain-containing protein n=1 Tax=Lysobacter enzymogenes TaxID=69 RepID=UPI00339AA680
MGEGLRASGLLADIWNESVGTEVPPTTTVTPVGGPSRPDALRSGLDAGGRGHHEGVRAQNT